MKVFVYGTLKSGHGNNYILGTSQFLGEAKTKQSFGLATVGFPYLIPEARAKEEGFETLPVLGEVYEVSDQYTSSRLDSLEGISYGHYKKETINVITEQGEVEASAYVVGDKTSTKGLPSCVVLDNLLVY